MQKQSRTMKAMKFPASWIRSHSWVIVSFTSAIPISSGLKWLHFHRRQCVYSATNRIVSDGHRCFSYYLLLSASVLSGHLSSGSRSTLESIPCELSTRIVDQWHRSFSSDSRAQTNQLFLTFDLSIQCSPYPSNIDEFPAWSIRERQIVVASWHHSRVNVMSWSQWFSCISTCIWWKSKPNCKKTKF